MASNRIKGVTIEIGGDPTNLNKALSDVDKKLSKTQSTLRDVNKLLKLDPGNTDLLAQKQKLLQSAIDDTKTRLAQLKEAQKNANSTEDYDAIQREIVDTESKLKNLQKQYEEFGTVSGQKLQAVGESLQEQGKKIEGVGKKFMPVTKGVVAIGAAAVASAVNVDKGYDTIIKKTGATGETLDDLKEQMDNVFSDVPTDAETAGTAIGEVNTRFGLTGDTLGDVSKQFIEFAEINDTDVNSAIDSVDAIMTKFGVDTDDVGSVLGLMTKAGQDTGLSMDTLEGQLNKNGATLKEMGLGLTESVNLLAQFESNGVDSSAALTALRTAQKKSASSGKSLSSTLKTGIASIKGAKTETEALQIATQLFGTKGAAEMTQAIREGRLSVDDLSGSLGDYAGVVETTYKETLDPWDNMKVAINNLMLAGSELADSMFTVLKPIIDQVTQAVKDFTSWFNNLSDSQKETIVKIGLIVAAIGPLLVVFGKAVSGVGSVISIFGKLTGAIPGVIGGIGSLITNFGPLLIGGAVIAGVIAAVILIVKNWDKIKEAAKKLGEFVKKTFENLKKALAKVWDGIKTAVSKAWEGIKSKISSVVNGIKTTISNTWTKIKDLTSKAFNAVKTTISNIWNGIKTTVSNAVTNVKTKISNTWAAVKTTTKNAFNAVKTGVSNAFTGIKTTVSNAWTAIKTSTTNKLTAIKTTVSNAWTAVKTGVINKMTSIKTTITNAWTNIKNSVGNAMKNVKTTVSNAWTGIKTSVSNAMSNVKTKISNGWKAAKTATSNAFTGMKTTIKNSWTNIKTSISSSLTSIKTAVSNAWTGIKNNVGTVWEGVKSTITSKLSSAKTSISNIMAGMKSTLSKTFNIGNPFSSMITTARNAINTLKNIFSGVRLSLPRIKMPHFSVSWRDIGGVVKLPSISVSWYKKAYDNPVMFTQPTVLQTPAGAKGFGDGHGAEIVMGLNKLRELVGSSGETTINVYASPGMNVNDLANAVSNRLAALERQKQRVWA